MRETALMLTFGERWKVLDFRNSKVIPKPLAPFGPLRCMDYLGVLDGKELFFISARGVPIDKEGRWGPVSASEKVNTTAQAVKNTLGGMIAAIRSGEAEDTLTAFFQSLLDRGIPIRVVLWLVGPSLSDGEAAKLKSMAVIMTHMLKADLKWLTHDVLVCVHPVNGLPDVTLPPPPPSGGNQMRGPVVP